MNKKEVDYLNFNFDNSHILSMTSDDIVILRCNASLKDDDNYIDVVVYISKDLYHDIVEEWLEHKKSYYEITNGSFAGVGMVSFEEFEEIEFDSEEGMPWLLYWIDDEKEELKIRYEHRKARAFIAYDFTVDMEHG